MMMQKVNMCLYIYLIYGRYWVVFGGFSLGISSIFGRATNLDTRRLACAICLGVISVAIVGRNVAAPLFPALAANLIHLYAFTGSFSPGAPLAKSKDRLICPRAKPCSAAFSYHLADSE